MGRHYELVSVALGTWVSRHNSPQDAEDDALVDEIRDRLDKAVQAIVEDPRYAGVLSSVSDRSKVKITRAVMTCEASPAQWDAWTDKGQYLYLRYRWGHGTVDAFPDNNSDAWNRVPNGRVASFQDEDQWAGEITLEEFCERAGLLLGLED